MDVRAHNSYSSYTRRINKNNEGHVTSNVETLNVQMSSGGESRGCVGSWRIIPKRLSELSLATGGLDELHDDAALGVTSFFSSTTTHTLNHGFHRGW